MSAIFINQLTNKTIIFNDNLFIYHRKLQNRWQNDIRLPTNFLRK